MIQFIEYNLQGPNDKVVFINPAQVQYVKPYNAGSSVATRVQFTGDYIVVAGSVEETRVKLDRANG